MVELTALIRAGVGTVAARVDYGRWIADCLWCNGAGLITVRAPIFECPCGALWEVVWPSEDMLHGIHRLLLMRPPENRWWAPGDTLTLLLIENVEHGVMADIPAELPGTASFVVREDRIIVDLLPAVTSQVAKAVTA